jgi:hypothetical protein
MAFAEFATMPRGFVRLLVGLAITVAAGRASADLCGPTDDPCVVTANVALPGGTIIDLGSRALMLGGTCTLTVQGAGTLSIVAGDITLAPGAKILAPGANGVGGSVILNASGAMLMGEGAKIDVSAGSAGDVTIDADHAQLDGSIRAEATTRDGDGGYVSLSATNDASIGGGGVDVNGGDRDGFGGFLDVFVGGDLRVTALLEAKGGEGSDLYLDAGGDLLVEPGGELTTIALTPFGDGGSVTLNAGGLVSVAGPMSLAGAGDWNEGGGDGGDLDINAERAVISASIDMSGGHPDGSGGFFDVFAIADVTMAGSLLVTGPSDGVGGDALVDTLGPITITGTIDVSGGFAGGSFEPSTRGAFELAPGAVVSVAGTPGSTFGGYGGTVFIEACDATLAGTLDAGGLGGAPQATVQTFTGGALTVSGVVEGPGGVTFHYRSEPPTITATASILPEPTIVQEPTIPCCGMCTTTTSSSSTTSTTVDTTSTTVPSTTTTSTSSSVTTTTSTTTTIVTSTTTTTVATTTSTTVTTSTSSTSTSSTSVVTTSTSSTTPTTLPLSCLDEPLQGYAAVDCATTELQDMVAAQSQIALGGRKSAKRLAGKVTKTRKFVEKSRASRRAAKLLVKAEKKVVSFETQIAKLLAQEKIDDGLANELLALAGEVTARIDAVRTPPAS